MTWRGAKRRKAGSSPHPWGTPQGAGRINDCKRFIPTPVGNTHQGRASAPPLAVHPHTRGEHMNTRTNGRMQFGSSPHPWGTLTLAMLDSPGMRFIPTPVGNTGAAGPHQVQPAVHPHTRGEHAWLSGLMSSRVGSSPHPWGTQCLAPSSRLSSRFIPTPVGNTCSASPAGRAASVHPHTRGEHGLGCG